MAEEDSTEAPVVALEGSTGRSRDPSAPTLPQNEVTWPRLQD